MAGRLRPRKSLGQHFLVDKRFISWFHERVCGARSALEIGVGTGALTSRLASCVGFLAGVEIDERLVPHAMLAGDRVSSDLVIADALEPPLRLNGFEVVYGSIPYNITGPLLSLLAKTYRGRVALMLQKEVVDRLRAEPGTKDYGRLTILVRLVFRVIPGPVVPPKAFRPRPKVYSQLVELLPLPDAAPPSIVECVEKVTVCLFSERRKLAAKVVKRCFNSGLPSSLASKRVYQLTPSDILWIISELGLCNGE